MSMSEREKLLSFLFDRNDGFKLENLKFFTPRAADEERASAAARRVMQKLWSADTLISVPPPASKCANI